MTASLPVTVTATWVCPVVGPRRPERSWLSPVPAVLSAGLATEPPVPSVARDSPPPEGEDVAGAAGAAAGVGGTLAEAAAAVVVDGGDGGVGCGVAVARGSSAG